MNIFIIQQRNWAFKFGIPLAKHLKNKFPGSKFATLVYKPEVWNFLKKDNFDYEYMWLGYKNDDRVNDQKIKNIISKISISDIEKNLNIESIWKDLVYCDRNIVYTPGVKWRYKYSKQLSNEKIIDLVKFNYYFVKEEIYKNFKPDIVFAPNFGSLFHNVLFHFLKHKNIDCWMPTASKISKRLILTNEIDYSLSKIVDDFNSNNYDIENIVDAKKYIHDFRKNYIPPDQYKYETPKSTNVEYIYKQKPLLVFDNLLKLFLIEFLKLPLKLFRQYKKNKNKNNPKLYNIVDNTKVIDTLKNFFTKYKYFYDAKNLKYLNVDNIKNNFFYFPLHVEPEISTNLWAPYFTNQLEVIRNIAISLPNNYTLIVKEHPIFIGRRSKKYYLKIQGLPNVNLVSPNIENKILLNHNLCKGSFVISGTVGFESLLLKKFTFVFSNFFYTVLPHAQQITSYNEITKKINLINHIDLNSEENEDKLLKLITILYQNSFELSYSAIQLGLKSQNIDNFLLQCEKKIYDIIKT